MCNWIPNSTIRTSGAHWNIDIQRSSDAMHRHRTCISCVWTAHHHPINLADPWEIGLNVEPKLLGSRSMLTGATGWTYPWSGLVVSHGLGFTDCADVIRQDPTIRGCEWRGSWRWCGLRLG